MAFEEVVWEEVATEEVATEEVALMEVALGEVATEEVAKEEVATDLVALEEVATNKEEDTATVASSGVEVAPGVLDPDNLGEELGLDKCAYLVTYLNMFN